MIYSDIADRPTWLLPVIATTEPSYTWQQSTMSLLLLIVLMSMALPAQMLFMNAWDAAPLVALILYAPIVLGAPLLLIDLLRGDL